MLKKNWKLSQRIKLWREKSVISLFLMILTLFSLASPVIATGVYDLPSPNTEDVWVVDQANEISLATTGQLQNSFKNLAEETGQEIRMVAIRRLDYGQTIEDLADEIFNSWYPTQEARANQTLLVMDTLTNTVAIRTGKVATALVNPEIAESVVKATVGYNLRNGNKYNQALIDASDRLMAVLSGEPDPGPPVIDNKIQVEGTFTKAEDTDAESAFTWVIVLLILATVIPMVTYFWYVM